LPFVETRAPRLTRVTALACSCGRGRVRIRRVAWIPGPRGAPPPIAQRQTDAGDVGENVVANDGGRIGRQQFVASDLVGISRIEVEVHAWQEVAPLHADAAIVSERRGSRVVSRGPQEGRGRK